MKRRGCYMICAQEKTTVRVVGRNREVAAAGERLILDILADARAKRASAKDAADVGEDGDARDDERGGDEDRGEGKGGAENRAGESPEKTKPAKDAEEDAENITAKGTEAKAEAEADADDDADAKVGAGDANEADAKGVRTRRRAVAAVAAEGAWTRTRTRTRPWREQMSVDVKKM